MYDSCYDFPCQQLTVLNSSCNMSTKTGLSMIPMTRISVPTMSSTVTGTTEINAILFPPFATPVRQDFCKSLLQKQLISSFIQSAHMMTFT